MGKKARAKRHVEKMNAKKAVKASRRLQYESLRGTSKNKKSKREVRRGKRASGGVVMALREKMLILASYGGRIKVRLLLVHGGPECGNVGCKRCSEYWRNAVDKAVRK